MRWITLPLLVLAFISQRASEVGTISTYVETPSSEPRRLATDTRGNLFIVDGTSRVLKLGSDGVLTTVAGTGTPGFGGDGGPALNAQLTATGLAVNSAGDLYIAGGGRIRRVSGGIINTVAGTGQVGFGGDGRRATTAQMDPRGLAFDSDGNIYVADGIRVRKITENGIIRTIAGGGFVAAPSQADGGPARAAQFSSLSDIGVDVVGNIYVADSGARLLRKISARGVISTVTSLDAEYPFTVDKDGTLYIAENARLRKISLFAVIASEDLDGLRRVQLQGPTRFSQIDSHLTNYVFDFSFIAGTGSPGFSGDGGPATTAQLSAVLSGVTLDAAGNLYVADTGNKRIRKVSGKS